MALPGLSEAGNPSGQAVIRGPAGCSEIVITTTERVAGAIDSLTWNGKEFIDSADHGRQLQSASNLDCGTPIQCEPFNPTEAGSCRDGAGGRSSSRLLFFVAGNNALQSVTQMAFWLAPGETSAGLPAKNTAVLSNHLLAKHVRIGHPGLPHVIDYDVMFTVPVGESHTEATFEALTGYMPPDFSRFLRFDPQSGRLEPISDGPGENPDPVALATPDGSHAMGIFAPPQPWAGWSVRVMDGFVSTRPVSSSGTAFSVCAIPPEFHPAPIPSGCRWWSAISKRCASRCRHCSLRRPSRGQSEPFFPRPCRIFFGTGAEFGGGIFRRTKCSSSLIYPSVVI